MILGANAGGSEDQLLAMLVGAAWSVAVAYFAIGSGLRFLAHSAFFAMLMFVAGAFAVAATAGPLPTYPVQVRFSSPILAESHVGVVRNGADLPLVQWASELETFGCDEANCEYLGVIEGADPTRDVTVSVGAVGANGEVAESNAIVIPPQVALCRQMDVDGQPGVTVTDAARVMQAVTEGECP